MAFVRPFCTQEFNTALLWASRGEESEENLEIVNMLLDKKANIEAKNTTVMVVVRNTGNKTPIIAVSFWI